MSTVNRRHKDRLFGFLFGNEAHRDWTLSLYNAVSGSSHSNPDDILITTISDVIYMGMKNDVSFLISDILNIYEQQSSFNPNMPVRMLMYAGRLYDKFIHQNCRNIYSSSLVRLPAPRLLVFYNGPDDRDDTVLRLSDAFDANAPCPGREHDLEVRVRMININYGRSQTLMRRCAPLAEYSWLIDRIRRYCPHMGIDHAVDRALEDMPDDFLIRSSLLANRAKVKNMCITEYNETETMLMFKEEGRREGRAEGRALGRMEAEAHFGKLMSILLSKGLTEEARLASVDESMRNELYRKYGIV